MSNANLRNRRKKSAQKKKKTNAENEDHSSSNGIKGNPKQNGKVGKFPSFYDSEADHVQIVIRNILLASLISMTLIVLSVLIFGGQSVRSTFHFDAVVQNDKQDLLSKHPKKYKHKRKHRQHEPLHEPVQETDYDFITDEMNDRIASSTAELRRTNDFLSKYVCQDAHEGAPEDSQRGYCHPLLRADPQRRTHKIAPTKSNHTLEFREVVMTLPRHLLVWDLDAMRDPFVRKELFAARHKDTGNALDGGAFLAAFLVRKQLIGRGKWNTSTSTSTAHKQSGSANAQSKEDARLMEFLDILPSYKTFESTHPTLWPVEELERLLGRMTLSFNLVMGYKNMMVSEYNAFCKASAKFKENVDMEAYIAMRLSVMSRSFGPGPPGPEEEIVGIHGLKTLKEELQFYKNKAGVNFLKGCRAMSPILDMWDHHANPNVEWRYDSKKRAFVIYSSEKDGIPPMQDIMVSYGKYTDTHLFAKFGFNNGDGSGYTEASLAVMHPLLDLGMGSQFSNLIHKNGKPVPSKEDQNAQKQTLVNYLRYDDGYEECISKENNPEGYKLKLLKLRHLQKIANKYDRWTFNISPRNGDSQPSLSSNIPITSGAPKFDPQNVKFNGNKIIATCRLIALTVDDYNGKAVEVLEKALSQDEFFVKKQSDALEFRSLTTMSRLVTGALARYPSSVKEDIRILSLPPSSSSHLKFQSKEWVAAQTRLGEMQSLEALRSISTSGFKQMKNLAERELPSTHPSLKIHRSTCPREVSAELLKETSFEL